MAAFAEEGQAAFDATRTPGIAPLTRATLAYIGHMASRVENPVKSRRHEFKLAQILVFHP